MESELQQRHFELKKLMEDKKEKERIMWLAEETLRKKKNDHFNTEQEKNGILQEEERRT